MKMTFTIILFLAAMAATAQTSAIIHATINVIAPDETDMPGQAPGGRMSMRNMMDGETKTTTWIKNDMVKTNFRSDVNKSTIIRDNAKEKTTIIMEMMGSKFAFAATDAEAADVQRRADSARRARRGESDSANVPRPPREIEFVEGSGETKKIIGYMAKKAYLVTTRPLGFKDSSTIWYTPDLKVNFAPGLGSLRGIPGISSAPSGFEKVPGTILRLEMAMGADRRMEVDVTKIETGKEIADKEFDIPKDVDVKPMSEMRNMFGGGPR